MEEFNPADYQPGRKPERSYIWFVFGAAFFIIGLAMLIGGKMEQQDFPLKLTGEVISCETYTESYGEDGTRTFSNLDVLCTDSNGIEHTVFIGHCTGRYNQGETVDILSKPDYSSGIINTRTAGNAFKVIIPFFIGAVGVYSGIVSIRKNRQFG